MRVKNFEALKRIVSEESLSAVMNELCIICHEMAEESECINPETWKAACDVLDEASEAIFADPPN